MRNLPPKQSIDTNVIRQVQGDLDAETIAAATKPERGLLGKLWDKVPSVGGEHLKAWLKKGYHEVTPLLDAFPTNNVRAGEEPGVFGNESLPHLIDQENTYDPEPRPVNDKSRSR